MITLFKTEKPKGKRIYRVECLDKNRGISSAIYPSKDGKKYVTILCLPYRTKKTTFLSKMQAIEEMNKYRALYKQKVKA